MDERKTLRRQKQRAFQQNCREETYFWCPYHNENNGQWVIHKPSECRNKLKQQKDGKEETAQANMAAAFDTMDSDEEE